MAIGSNPLPQSFFSRPALEVAPDLLGTFLVVRKDGVLYKLMISEVEAYIGEHDLACHARAGKTARTAPLYGPPGHFYVYFIYGMYWMLNIVTDYEGYPSGVLIRSAGSCIGPGRLTQFCGITKELKGKAAIPENGAWFEGREVEIDPSSIITTPRIGVSYAGEWAEKPYRFLLDSSQVQLRETIITSD